MSDQPNENPAPAEAKEHRSIEISQLTVRDILRISSRITLGSSLSIIAVFVAVISATWVVSSTYENGSFPKYVYDVTGSPKSVRLEEKLSNANTKIESLENELQDLKERSEEYDSYIDRIADPQLLFPLAENILADNPDGLEDVFEVAASLLWQTKASREGATFLSGEKKQSVKFKFSEDNVELEWDEKQSLIPEILRTHLGRSTDEDIRRTNSNLNRAGFSPLEGKGYILRGLDGSLSVSIYQR